MDQGDVVGATTSWVILIYLYYITKRAPEAVTFMFLWIMAVGDRSLE